MSLGEASERYGVNEYEEINRVSALEARSQSGLDVVCFSEIFRKFEEPYVDFDHIQFEYEEVLFQESLCNDKLRSQLGAIARNRAMKHMQILGRPEEHDELVIRYAAQYMALVPSIRTCLNVSSDDLVVLNYPTPNLKYLNLKPDLARCNPSVAVVETVVERDRL